jgi:hypothetical protein
VGLGYSTRKIAAKKDMVEINPCGKQVVDAVVKQGSVEVGGVKPSLEDKATQDLGGMHNPGVVHGLSRQDAGLRTSENRGPMPRWCPSGLTKTQ